MPPLLGSLVVFGASAAVLALEILAVRLLAPHLGITIEVTTGVIGTVLAGIALGTWVGGRVADRVDPRRLLGPILVLGGGLALAVIPMVGLLAGLDIEADPAGIVLYAGAAFFLPAAVLSATTPTVVKLQLHHLGRTGEVVGGYSAVGTVGAIAGSFLTGFVLVAALPTRPIVIGIGVALIAAGLLIAWRLGRARPGPLVALAVVIGVGGIAWTVASPAACQRESAYFCISVEAAAGDESERVLRMDTLRHAYVDLDDPTHLEFAYTRLLGDVADAMAPAGQPLMALHLGGGGFTLPRYIDATRPGSAHRVLELDPVVLEVAQEELGFEPSPTTEVVLGDGRLGVAEAPSDHYDLVIGDAFGGPAVPWHLTTTEFVSEVQRALRRDGIYAVNIIDYPPLSLARAQLATMAEVFEHTAIFGPSSRVTGSAGGNVILLASDEPIPVDDLRAASRAHGGTAVVATDPETIAQWTAGAPVLRDDFAPTDQLLTR
ncbi:MAG: fused MFS/spermidine synthase [Candidatus Limnocylindrales bacterium]